MSPTVNITSLSFKCILSNKATVQGLEYIPCLTEQHQGNTAEGNGF